MFTAIVPAGEFYLAEDYHQKHSLRGRRQLLEEVQAKGYAQVRIESLRKGPDDVLDICRLSCLEHNIQVVEQGAVPVLQVRGANVVLVQPEKETVSE